MQNKSKSQDCVETCSVQLVWILYLSGRCYNSAFPPVDVTGPPDAKRPKINPAEGGGDGHPSTPATLPEGRAMVHFNSCEYVMELKPTIAY